MNKKIDGDKFHNAFLHGGKKIIDNKTHLNEINVFPVPDGDTGSNLSHTVKSVMKNSTPKPSVAETSHSMAEAALIGSRGNIGMIFAQFLMGVSKAAENRNHLTPQSFSSVMKEAVSHTYQATENPVDGTILTVMKDWAKNLQTEEKQNEGFTPKLSRSLKQAKSSLRKTRDKLEVLKKPTS